MPGIFLALWLYPWPSCTPDRCRGSRFVIGCGIASLRQRRTISALPTIHSEPRWLPRARFLETFWAFVASAPEICPAESRRPLTRNPLPFRQDALTSTRPFGVGSTAFGAQSPDLCFVPSMDLGFAIMLVLACPALTPPSPILVHQQVLLLRASFLRFRVLATPSHFANPPRLPGSMEHSLFRSVEPVRYQKNRPAPKEAGRRLRRKLPANRDR